ncbi:MAG: class I SAM-dependent methyltransferase [Candidatus Omnitrophota bacterium]
MNTPNKLLRKVNRFIGKRRALYYAKVDKASLWNKIDGKIVDELNSVMHKDNEGSILTGKRGVRVMAENIDYKLFLRNPSLVAICEQVRFISSLLSGIKPNRIIEIGTHKGMFCYLVSLYDNTIEIDTFGNLFESQKAVDILNAKFGTHINFIYGDSQNTFREYAAEKVIDFAWVDGGHSYEVCTSDLINCRRLNIPHIAVDDYVRENAVKKSVHDFIKQTGYAIGGRSNFAIDGRGIVYLRDKTVRRPTSANKGNGCR